MEIERINQPPVRTSFDDVVSDRAATRRVERSQNQATQRVDLEQAKRGDSLEISDQARELARARQAVDAAPDVRTDKVSLIRKRIEDGTYTVSPELLARKLLDGSERTPS